MSRVVAAVASLSLLAAAGPALAAPKPAAKYSACKPPSGSFVVKPGKPLTQTPTTPTGVLGDFEQNVGDFYMDLSGKRVGTKGTLTFELSWLSPVSDYDLVVNGVNELSSDNPETISLSLKHCKPVTLGIDVFLGAPVEELTLTTTAR